MLILAKFFFIVFKMFLSVIKNLEHICAKILPVSIK